jgi:hypothetical protein
LPKARDFGETVPTEDALPVPERATVCGLVGSESRMFRVAALAPVDRGVMNSVMVQVVPFASVAPHEFVWLKSPGLVPVIVKGLRVRDAVLRFVTVTVFAGLVVPRLTVPNPTVLALTDTAVVPDPLSVNAWGLPPALSVMLMLPIRAPVDWGMNVTLIVQLAPAAKLDPQLLLWLKSPGFVPAGAMLEMVKAALPVFDNVAVCIALGVR